MVLNDLVDSFCYSQKNAGLKGLIVTEKNLWSRTLTETETETENSNWNNTDECVDGKWTEDAVELSSLDFILLMMALVAVNLLVIVGNVMVIAAVFTHSKLRSTTTNKFVVSLAVADLMVGLIVLPFSSVNQVIRSPLIPIVLFISTHHRIFLQFHIVYSYLISALPQLRPDPLPKQQMN